MQGFDRRGRGLSLLILGAIVGLRGAPVAGNEGPAPVSVVVVDLAHLDGVPLEVAVAEADSALDPLRFRVSWSFAQAGKEIPLSPIRVVLLGRRPCGREKSENVFASVTPANDAATIWVCVPNLMAAPAVRRPGSSGADLRRLGVGLGRVIVHEIVHLADPGLEHGEGRPLLLDAQPKDAGRRPRQDGARRGRGSSSRLYTMGGSVLFGESG